MYIKIKKILIVTVVLAGILFLSACSEEDTYYPIGAYTVKPVLTLYAAIIVKLDTSTYEFGTLLIPNRITDMNGNFWERSSGTPTTDNPFLGVWKYKDMVIEFHSSGTVTGNAKARDFI